MRVMVNHAILTYTPTQASINWTAQCFSTYYRLLQMFSLVWWWACGKVSSCKTHTCRIYFTAWRALEKKTFGPELGDCAFCGSTGCLLLGVTRKSPNGRPVSTRCGGIRFVCLWHGTRESSNDSERDVRWPADLRKAINHRRVQLSHPFSIYSSQGLLERSMYLKY